MIDAVLFDFDGTLADTAADLGAALNRLLTESGRAPLPLQAIRPHVSQGVRGLLGIGFGMTPEDASYAAFRQRFLASYDESLCAATALFDGVAGVLEWLEAKRIIWGVVTNKHSRYTLPIMASLGLTQRAACIVSGDSSPRPKPAPDPLWLASALINVDPARCLYIGDDLRDIQSARAAGMGAIAAAWGYLGEETPLEKWGADAIIQAPADLVGLLAGA
ncbi:MAG: HAD hydrolase-like protein [Zoogloeaceae bacterium]|jgi:phosphoglycolate phosphatase|nr:HAD hydrolase-like protein [Zoogloeaceae bacterium]